MCAQDTRTGVTSQETAARMVVTGASGVIGQRLCEALVARGVQVVALLRSPRPGPWGDVLHCDLGRDTLDPTLLHGVDTIFHLAGKAHTRARTAADVREYETVHVTGTRSLMQAARAAGVRCCVLLSSVKAMGEGSAEIQDENSPCVPETPYGQTKHAAERIALHELPVPCPVVLRPALVYGAGSKGNLDLMIRAMSKGMFPRTHFPPNARSMIHVKDVIQACVLAATHKQAYGGTYILTDGKEYSTNDLLAWIQDSLGKKSVLTMPFDLLRLAARLGDIVEKFGMRFPLTSDRLDKLAGSACYSNAKICRELGFVPQWDAQRGIQEMVTHLVRP
ncbi:NAD-dependent epimerase/dehydratase family protein [Desulfovibrionales bacterium]